MPRKPRRQPAKKGRPAPRRRGRAQRPSVGHAPLFRALAHATLPTSTTFGVPAITASRHTTQGVARLAEVEPDSAFKTAMIAGENTGFIQVVNSPVVAAVEFYHTTGGTRAVLRTYDNLLVDTNSVAADAGDPTLVLGAASYLVASGVETSVTAARDAVVGTVFAEHVPPEIIVPISAAQVDVIVRRLWDTGYGRNSQKHLTTRMASTRIAPCGRHDVRLPEGWSYNVATQISDDSMLNTAGLALQEWLNACCRDMRPPRLAFRDLPWSLGSAFHLRYTVTAKYEIAHSQSLTDSAYARGQTERVPVTGRIADAVRTVESTASKLAHAAKAHIPEEVTAVGVAGLIRNAATDMPAAMLNALRVAGPGALMLGA